MGYWIKAKLPQHYEFENRNLIGCTVLELSAKQSFQILGARNIFSAISWERFIRLNCGFQIRDAETILHQNNPPYVQFREFEVSRSSVPLKTLSGDISRTVHPNEALFSNLQCWDNSASIQYPFIKIYRTLSFLETRSPHICSSFFCVKEFEKDFVRISSKTSQTTFRSSSE